MNETQTNLLNKIFSDTFLGKKLLKGVQTYLKSGLESGIKCDTSEDLMNILRNRAKQKAKFDLWAIMDATPECPYEYHEDYNNDFFESMGSFIINLLPLGIPLEELESDFEEILLEAVKDFHNKSAYRYLRKLEDDDPCHDAKTSEELLTKIFEHLESADSTVQECLSLSIKELLEIASIYKKARGEELKYQRDAIYSKIQSLQNELDIIEQTLGS